MTLFLFANIHQGDELFSVHSRGKQCAFMSLSALLTARNIPLFAWSFTTFNDVLIQGDKMYLRALNNGLLVLNPGIEYLSIDNLPTIVTVNNSCTNACSTITNSGINLPVEVAQNMNLPVEVAQNTNLPVEVAQNTNLPVEVAQNINLPVEVAQNINLPVEVAQNINLPVEVAGRINSDRPIVVEPIQAQNNIDLPIVLEEQIGKNEKQIWFVTYGKQLQGLVITDWEIEFPYYDIHTALLNIFLNDSHAILILEGYMMAIVKQMNDFFLFDSHARNSIGMPDPNGTAVVMKFTNILELLQYLYSLSMELHTNSFEIVPVQLNKYIPSKSKTKGENDREYQKKRRSVETASDKLARLKKASDYKKKMQSEETDSQTQIRLQKVRQSIKRKHSNETENGTNIRLQKQSESLKRRHSEETDSERQDRLQKENVAKKRKRSEESDNERQNRLEKDRLSKKQ